ncbi:MAG: Gldg family protein [Phycisphaeraceae bacterium]
MRDHNDTSKTPSEPEAAPPTRPVRWLKYGSSVAALVLATAAIVVMVNWLGYHNYQRFDFTHTRQYSLSPQTMKLLEQLDANLHITTLYADGTAPPELFRRVQDVLDEYHRRSPQVSVAQIDPTIQRDRFLPFMEELSTRFDDEISANRDALTQVRQTYSRMRNFADEQTEQLANLLPILPPSSQDLMLVLPELNRTFMRLGADLQTYEDELNDLLSQDMPDFATARPLAVEPLVDMNDGVLDVALQRFEVALADPATPDEVEDILLGMRRDYRDLVEALREARQTLERVDSKGYDKLRQAVLQTNSLVVAMDAEASRHRVDRGLVVLTLDEIYPNLALAQMSEGEVQPEQGYKGEEAISGAIMQLTLEHDTKVVFVNPTPRSVIESGNPQTTYAMAAERLRQLNFEVVEWQPEGRIGEDGRPERPRPRPVAEPGQQMVFIALPAPSRSQRTTDTEPASVRAVRNHLEAGDPAMVILRALGPSELGDENPLLPPLSELGINVDPTRVAMQHTAGSGGRVQGTTQLVLDSWPSDHILSSALQGLQGVVLQGVPLTLDPPEDAQAWPLVQTPSDTWAGTDFFEAARARPGDNDPQGPLTVAAAAEKDDSRVIVIGDRVFATDMVAQSGPQNATGQVMFSQFPANQELFVNSIYWLAGMDDLIAPGARTQDTRRIAAITTGQMRWIGWSLLAGLPAMCLMAGLGVWFVRRQ